MRYQVCKICNHQIINEFDYVVYSDDEHGLGTATICKHCYALHVLKYYPKSRVADYMKNNPTEFHLTLEERGFAPEAEC